jgi:tetratricopeptide (TPR) repeat protein
MAQPSTESLVAEAQASLVDRRPADALSTLRPLLEAGEEDAAVLNVAARALNNLGRLEDAAGLLRRVLQVDAQDLQALTNLGHVRARSGDAEEASEAWSRALAIQPRHAEALKGLGRLAAEAGRLEAAAGYLGRAADVDPEDADNWLNLAELMQFLERPAAAEAAYRRVVEVAPDRTVALEGLGRLLYSGGRVAEAADAYRSALRLDPSSQVSAAGLALCLEVMGQREEGLAALAPFVDAPDPAPGLDYAAGRLLAGDGRLEESVERLRRSASSGDPDWARNPAPWYSLGGVLDRLGHHEDAFEAWRQANRRKPAHFNPLEFRARADAVVGHFHDALPGGEKGGVRPVFIVGMPRSGTTLIEQMLACHPLVHAGGEQLTLEAMADRLWRDGCRVDTNDADETHRLKEKWLVTYGEIDATATRFTDKYPANFMHLGLAKRLFPEAMIVWCRRDPGDTALSIFANDFNRKIVPWATKLEHIAQVWIAQERLMAHWERTLELPVIRVQYEETVEHLETVARGLLERLGLSWEPRCLEFHRSGRLANTASFDQVRRPVYSSSVGRARPYRSFLEPFYRAIEA